MEKTAENLAYPEFAVYNPELADRQERVVAALALARESGVESGYLNMATGTGKTHVAAEDVRNYLLDRPAARILILCHQTEILAQAEGKFTKILPGHVTHGRIYSGEIQDQAQVTYASFQQLRSKYAGGKLYEAFQADEFDYIVVDESHHGPAETYRPIIEHFEPKFMLGLTATPDRRDQQDIAEIFGQELHRLYLEEAIARGYVAKVDYRVLTDHVRKIEELAAEEDSLTLSEINEHIFIPKREEEIVAEIHRQIAEVEHPRILVFTPNIRAADRLAELMPQPAAAIHHKILDRHAQAALAKFRSGELQTLTVVDKFNEGVDLPEANVVVFLRSTTSKTIYLQQLGRGLRKVPGKPSVLALDFVATWERIEMVNQVLQGAKDYLQSRPRPAPMEVPFRFDFSQEATDVIETIKMVRAKKKSSRQSGPTYAELVEELKALVSTDRLPSQRQLTAEQDRRYASQIMKGDLEAREAFVMRKLLSVYRAAKNYPERDGLTVADHFQNGCEGLYRGIDAYGGGRRDVSLSTYIVAYIHNRIKRKLHDARLIRIPVNKEEKIQKIQKSREKLEKKLFREPTPFEIDEDCNLEPYESEMLERDSQEIYPLDQAESTESRERGAFDIATEQITHEQLSMAFEGLGYRERRVLELRYGLGDEHPRTLDEIGRIFNVTRERIRQIENQSLKKLQIMAEAQPLRELEIDESGIVRASNAVRAKKYRRHEGSKKFAYARLEGFAGYLDERDQALADRYGKQMVGLLRLAGGIKEEFETIDFSLFRRELNKRIPHGSYIEPVHLVWALQLLESGHAVRPRR